MKEGHRRQYKWQLNKFNSTANPFGTVGGVNGNISRAKIIVRLVGGHFGTIGIKYLLPQKLGNAGSTPHGAVSESSGQFDLFGEFGHNVPNTFRGVGGAGAVETEDIIIGRKSCFRRKDG